MKHILPALALLLTALPWAQSSERIRLNQVGFAVGEMKYAITLDSAATAVLIDSATGAAVWQGTPAARVPWSAAKDTGSIIDFSAYNVPGTYRLQVGSEISRPVHIAADPFTPLSRASIKAFWYNRASYALTAPYAEQWARAAGHPDTLVRIHPSAATAARPASSTIRSPGGWYDAGDYGKYIVNSGISTWTLMNLYESAPTFFDTLSLNVPAHSGPHSDLIDEILWNLRWMLTMQDPGDGGVYHKLTTANFSGFVMPKEDVATRYVVQKSTAATLDFAAVTAYAARLFHNIPELTTLADSCLTASRSAWTWARLHPDSIYNQDTMNARYNPDISTGTYADNDVSDELLWASAELFLTTQEDSFATAGSLTSPASSLYWPSWSDVSSLAWLELLDNPSLLTGSMSGLYSKLQSQLLSTVKSIRSYRDRNGYHVPEGGFWWGGNAAFANNGLLLWKAWKATGDTGYRSASLEVLDYLLGRNATGYCFVTGFGSKSPMNIHHRPSSADGIDAPDPGFLVGGPNSGQEDGCSDYPSKLGPKSYVDEQSCYAVNEVAINWNAPLAYLSGVWAASLTSGSSSGITGSGHLTAAGQLTVRTAAGHLTVSASRTLTQVELWSVNGQRLARVSGPAASLELSVPEIGLLIVRARDVTGAALTRRVLVP